MRLKKCKAAVLVAVAVAGLAVATTPAHASECQRGGGVIICEFGVAKYTHPNGSREEWAIGVDSAVWHRWTNANGSWTGWSSLGGIARSGPHVNTYPDSDVISISVRGTNNDTWFRTRHANGSWSPWENDDCC
ncbi:hypothetical protein ABCR94_31660 [Streptomyces sp. 21So2-11]|uniref:hypothetical protein n=1 Tax=Streptomyces sp. 21So2-11 TaxID=3144408 RepID=UPI00321B32AA